MIVQRKQEGGMQTRQTGKGEEGERESEGSRQVGSNRKSSWHDPA